MKNLMRLNKYIANSGYTSRRKADELIKAGKVIVNGEIMTEMGHMVDPENDYIKIGNKNLNLVKADLYYVCNKPLGYLSANSDKFSDKLARDLIHYKGHLFNVGRLDKDTSGLIIYTNDGDFANIMMHPSFEINKKYIVSVSGRLTDEIADTIRTGVQLSDGITKECKLYIKKSNKYESLCEIIISEGKNREIRRMFEHFGLKVKELKRVSHGKIKLDNLPIGGYREFNNEELEYVKEIKSRG